MDINILNSGSVESKNWLNPVFGVVRCGELITIPSPLSNNVFNLYRSAVVNIPPAFVTAPCNLVGIPNADMNLATNVYTAPRDCFLSINYSMVVNWQPTATAIICFVYISVNGNPTYLYANYNNSNTGAVVGSFPLQINGILKVNEGDTVGVEFSFNGVGTGFSYSSVTFSGQII